MKRYQQDGGNIEITENTLMSNIEDCSAMLKDFSNLGIDIAIDDFGTD